MATPSPSICGQATCQYIRAFSGSDLWICLIAGSPSLHCMHTFQRRGHCSDRFPTGLIHHTLRQGGCCDSISQYIGRQLVSGPISCLWPSVKAWSRQLKHTIFMGNQFISMESLQSGDSLHVDFNLGELSCRLTNNKPP